MRLDPRRLNMRGVSSFVATSSPDATSPTRVADVMRWGLVSCPADASLESVARLMSTEQVHCVVVMDASEAVSLWGVVSDLDLVAAASVRPLSEQPAGGSGMRPAVTITPSASLHDAARLMTRSGVAHLVVVDPVERHPVGVVSTLDLAGAFSAA
jgi:CBS domain-containing protein